jgi:5,5'-dehydrodivanillate O-demethylase oxygenase subunit
VPFKDAQGDFIVDNVDGQDMMAWISQGAIADRSKEHLGATDKGVAMYRRVLKRELKKMESGVDPIAVVRDAAKNVCIDLPNERKKHHNSDGFAHFMLRTHAKYSPIANDLVKLFDTKAAIKMGLIPASKEEAAA